MCLEFSGYFRSLKVFCKKLNMSPTQILRNTTQECIALSEGETQQGFKDVSEATLRTMLLKSIWIDGTVRRQTRLLGQIQIWLLSWRIIKLYALVLSSLSLLSPLFEQKPSSWHASGLLENSQVRCRCFPGINTPGLVIYHASVTMKVPLALPNPTYFQGWVSFSVMASKRKHHHSHLETLS